MPSTMDKQGAYVVHGTDLYVKRRPDFQMLIPVRGKIKLLTNEWWDYCPESFRGATGISALGLISIATMIRSPIGAVLTGDAFMVLAHLDVGLIRGVAGRHELAPDTALALIPHADAASVQRAHTAEARQ